MQDFSEQNITSAVIEAFQDTPSPRLKTVMAALVRHLHDFVREVDLTQEEAADPSRGVTWPRTLQQR
jgi:hypothetical protein